MSFSGSPICAFVEASNPVAEVCLIVQIATGPAVIWEWDLPYLLWANWGTDCTAAWLCEQFRQHDTSTVQLIGHRGLLQTLKHSLTRHQQDGGGER